MTCDGQGFWVERVTDGIMRDIPPVVDWRLNGEGGEGVCFLEQLGHRHL